MQRHTLLWPLSETSCFNLNVMYEYSVHDRPHGLRAVIMTH